MHISSHGALHLSEAKWHRGRHRLHGSPSYTTAAAVALLAVRSAKVRNYDQSARSISRAHPPPKPFLVKPIRCQAVLMPQVSAAVGPAQARSRS